MSSLGFFWRVLWARVSFQTEGASWCTALGAEKNTGYLPPLIPVIILLEENERTFLVFFPLILKCQSLPVSFGILSQD